MQVQRSNACTNIIGAPPRGTPTLRRVLLSIHDIYIAPAWYLYTSATVHRYSQYLEVTYFEKKIQKKVLRALAVFQVHVLRVLQVLVLIVWTVDTSGLAVSRGLLLWILPILIKYSGFCTAGTASTGNISSVGTASTRSSEILSMCPIY